MNRRKYKYQMSRLKDINTVTAVIKWVMYRDFKKQSGDYLITDGEDIEKACYDSENDSWFFYNDKPEFYNSNILYIAEMPTIPNIDYDKGDVYYRGKEAFNFEHKE